MASLASLELARDRAMDRSDTLIERAQEDLNRLGALRIKMADLQDQSTDYCGLSELAHEREAAVNDRVELEREVTAKNLAIASHQREIFCHREEISRKKQAIVVAEACIAAWVEHRERLIRDEGSAIDKQLATIDQRIEQAEQARAREERRVRRKMNEAQDRADKLLDRAAKIRREAGIEIDHHDADQEDVAGDDGPGRGQMVEVCRPGGGDERM
jgi:hypothetical protein